MVKKMEHTEEILSNFNIYGEYLDAQPYGSGHINDTILVTYMNLGEKKKYILTINSIFLVLLKKFGIITLAAIKF